LPSFIRIMYIGMKRAVALGKAKALAAGDEYESLPFTMDVFSCLTFVEIDGCNV
jgi:hypothetical protein